MLYLYHNYHDTHKLIGYVNKKYGYSFTYNTLKDLAHENGVKKKAQNMYSIAYVDRSDEKNIIELYQSEYREILPSGKAKLNKYRITLYGRELLENTERLGMVNNKTYVTKGPDLTVSETKFLNYIFRGIIDGDGWIRKDAKEFFICSASLDFIKWCEKAMLNLGFENIKVSFINNEYNGIYLIRTGSKYNLEVLREKIYNKPFGMMRKYNRLCKKDVQRL
jgi:hypothetical protein